MKPRPYQEKAIREIRASLPGRVCFVLPTGGGKSYIATNICTDYPGKVLAVAHRIELVEMLKNRLGCEVVTVQALASRGWSGEKVDLMVFDECHHLAAEEWRSAVESVSPRSLLGLTATPGPDLAAVFEKMIVGAYHSDLVSDGFLCKAEVYQPTERQQGSLAQSPVDAFFRFGKGKTFLFAPTVDLSKKWVSEFISRGVSAAHIDANTPKKKRAEIVELFKKGEIQLVSNVDILTEGFDAPEAETVILARAFASLTAYLQATGRGLRVYPGKEKCTVIDLSGCTHDHGFPTDDRLYVLGQEIKNREKIPPLRVCLECGHTQKSILDACSRCGFVFEKDDPRILKIRKEQLQRAADEKTPDYEKLKELRALVDEANRKGVHFYSLSKKYSEKYGKKPDLLKVCTEREITRERSRLVQRFGYGKGLGMWKGLFYGKK